MEEKHYIEWIEVIADGKAYRQFLKPGMAPEAPFEVQATQITAREYCNLTRAMEGLKKMTDPIQCSIDMLATALEMEEKGKAFYEKAGKSCRDPQCREIFSTLMADEMLHTEPD